MCERGPAYVALVARSGLDPATVREIEVRSLDGRVVRALRAGQRKRVPGYGTVHYICDYQSTPEVKLSDRLEHVQTYFVPATDPRLRPAPVASDDYWERSAEIVRKIAALDGRLHASGCRERGWIPILERAIDAIGAIIGVQDMITIACESCGWGLFTRIAPMRVDPPFRKYLSDLAEWINAVSSRTCVVTGAPGWRCRLPDDWDDIVLSDEMRSQLKSWDSDLIYPRPPVTPPGLVPP